jgi:DNA-directed RNA polymerase subunit M/transcription elongation factor TFIIS
VRPPEEAVVLKRLVCAVADHNWTRHRYPATEAGDQPEGTFLKCARCGKVDESEPGPSGPMVVDFM